MNIEQIIDKLESNNIQVSEYKEDGILCGYELNTYTIEQSIADMLET